MQRIHLKHDIRQTSLLLDHQYYCPNCGWWTDKEWEVFEGKTKQLTLEEASP